jgi:hypothetical protein
MRSAGDLAHLVPAVPISVRERRLVEVLVQEMIGVDDSVDHDGYAHALEQLVEPSSRETSGSNRLSPNLLSIS